MSAYSFNTLYNNEAIGDVVSGRQFLHMTDQTRDKMGPFEHYSTSLTNTYNNLQLGFLRLDTWMAYDASDNPNAEGVYLFSVGWSNAESGTYTAITPSEIEVYTEILDTDHYFDGVSHLAVYREIRLHIPEEHIKLYGYYKVVCRVLPPSWLKTYRPSDKITNIFHPYA